MLTAGEKVGEDAAAPGPTPCCIPTQVIPWARQCAVSSCGNADPGALKVCLSPTPHPLHSSHSSVVSVFFESMRIGNRIKLILAPSFPCHLAVLRTWRQCQAVGSWCLLCPPFVRAGSLMVKTAVTSLYVVASEEGRGDNFALSLLKVGIRPPVAQLFDPFMLLFRFIDSHPILLQERTGILSCLRFRLTLGFPPQPSYVLCKSGAHL